MSRLAQIRLSSEKSDQIQVGEFGYLWNSYSSTKNCKALLESIEENADHYRNQLQSIISIVLGAAQKSIQSEYKSISIIPQLLWASGLVEQGTVKTNAWLIALRLIAFERQLVISRVTKFIYRGPSRLVDQCLRNLSHQKGLGYIWQATEATATSSVLRRFWSTVPAVFKAQFYLCRYLLTRWSLRKLDDPNWSSGKNTVFLLSYFDNFDNDFRKSGGFRSKYWEQLPGQLQSQGFRLNWAHLFVTSTIVPDTQMARHLIGQLNTNSSQNGIHALLDQYLDWLMIVRVILDWLRSNLICLRFLRKGSDYQKKSDWGWIWPIFLNDLKDSFVGSVAIQNIFFNHLFDKMLGSMPRQTVGLYLMENQGWERIFLHFWRKHGHGTIIGVPHSTIRYWDLRYFDTQTHQSLGGLPQPDLVALNGEHAWQMLKSSGYPMDRCVRVEALRYQYLTDLKTFEPKTTAKGTLMRLLVLGDTQKETTHQMLLHLEEAFAKCSWSMEVWIKPHPNNPIELKKYRKLTAQLKLESLPELFRDVHVVMASVFTSASLDAFCFGLPLINYLDQQNFNFSPLRGHSKAKFVSSSNEINELLRDDHFTSTAPCVNASEFFWLDENLSGWLTLINSLENENYIQNL